MPSAYCGMKAHSPGGVVIFGSQWLYSCRQYACACGTWNGSSWWCYTELSLAVQRILVHTMYGSVTASFTAFKTSIDEATKVM